MEIIDVVDDQNRIIGQIPKSELYDGPHHHRIVHVLLFNERGNLALQLRSAHASFCPHYWSSVAGGHVRSGETVAQAARREMEEEIGISVPLTIFTELVYDPPQYPGMKKFLTFFAGRSEGPFTIDPVEVERVEFFPLESIRSMIARDEKIHPEFAFLLARKPEAFTVALSR